jgi:hypothetical protein
LVRVKQLFSTIVILLQAWMLFANMPASASVEKVCLKHSFEKMKCDGCCGMANCCVTKSKPGSEPAPAIPTQKNSGQNQISVPALILVLWNLPEKPANPGLLKTQSFLTPTSVPVYTRNCSFLI